MRRLSTEDITAIIVAMRPVIREEVNQLLTEKLNSKLKPIKDDINVLKDLMIRTWRFADNEYIAMSAQVNRHDKLLRVQGDRIASLLLKETGAATSGK